MLTNYLSFNNFSQFFVKQPCVLSEHTNTSERYLHYLNSRSQVRVPYRTHIDSHLDSYTLYAVD